MKKTLLVLFASVLFVINGNAQCNINGGTIQIYTPEPYCHGTPVWVGESSSALNVSQNAIYEWLVDGFSYGPGQQFNFVKDQSFGQEVQRKVTDLNTNCVAYSNTVYIRTLYPGINGGSILGNDTICNGAASTIINSNSLPSGGPNNGTDPGFYYSWQKSANGGNNYSDWTDISGATNTTYTPGVVTADTYFRRIDWSSVCMYGVISNVITKKVMNCGTFTSDISGPMSVTPNQTATYSVTPVVGMNYLWAVTGGTITGGQGTHSVTIMWDGGASANSSVSITETDATPESRTATQPIATITTGINKGLGSTGISVFPNPTKNQFTIEMPTANTAVNYTVYSTTGVQMQSGSFNAAASGNTITTQLPAGMYQLVLNYDGVFTSTRLAVIE